MATKKPNDGVYLLGRPAGHNSEVPHSFGHTQGKCPKCAMNAPYAVLCRPGGEPRVAGCEVGGDHLHRQCQCGYGWVERPYDQLLAAQEEGKITAENEAIAALASIVHRSDGVRIDDAMIQGYMGWTVKLTRDPERHTLVLTAEEAPKAGPPVHPELRPPGSPGMRR